jgi:hypothetical protein
MQSSRAQSVFSVLESCSSFYASGTITGFSKEARAQSAAES